MHFGSFSLGGRQLFQKLVLFFYTRLILFYQGDLYLTGNDTDQRQCAMEWPTTLWQHCFTDI
jgi:hypothetical protein